MTRGDEAGYTPRNEVRERRDSTSRDESRGGADPSPRDESRVGPDRRAVWIPSFRAFTHWRGATLVGLLLAASAGPAVAQDASTADVRQVIDRVFAGMHEADSAKVRSAFADGARFALLPEEGTTAVRFQPIDGWLEAIAGSEGSWEEKIYDVEIRVDADIAQAWTPYTFYLDGSIHHCGVDSIELLRTPDGWKITQLSDTQGTEGCRDVPDQ